MGLLDFFKRMKRNENVIYRLLWFEIQVTPFTFRFAILPEQPILIGYEGENGEKGKTMLIRYEHVPDVYESTVERVDVLVKESGVLELAPYNAEYAFSDDWIGKSAVHIRIAYADNTSWAGVFMLDELPKEINVLVQSLKELGKQIVLEQGSQKISAESAKTYIEPENNAAQKASPKVIVKINIDTSGKTFANGKEVTLLQLVEILDDLKNNNGCVWYSREAPDQEPSELVLGHIEKVLAAVADRELPIRLSVD